MEAPLPIGLSIHVPVRGLRPILTGFADRALGAFRARVFGLIVGERARSLRFRLRTAIRDLRFHGRYDDGRFRDLPVSDQDLSRLMPLKMIRRGLRDQEMWQTLELNACFPDKKAELLPIKLIADSYGHIVETHF